MSGGHESCIPPCRKEVSFFRNLIVTAPLQHAPYVVALHRGNHVRMIGFDEENGARVFYDVVSNDLPKILMNRCRSQVSRVFLRVLRFRFGVYFATRCYSLTVGGYVSSAAKTKSWNFHNTREPYRSTDPTPWLITKAIAL